MSDDVGYLRSIVETFHHGRPWTDDWLEPWAFSLSAASALLFWLTGHFYLATRGLQVVLSAAFFYSVDRLLYNRGFKTAS
jgi:hypothetical protein